MNKTRKIITDSLGFPLTVNITVGEFSDWEKDKLGRHVCYETEDGKVVPEEPHAIQIITGLDYPNLTMVAAHEAYHMFASVRHLITCDEETEAETFGELVKVIFELDEDNE